MVATGDSVDLAEWIIDDTYLVNIIFIMHYYHHYLFLKDWNVSWIGIVIISSITTIIIIFHS